MVLMGVDDALLCFGASSRSAVRVGDETENLFSVTLVAQMWLPKYIARCADCD
jgi:hypothetical protein